MTARADPWSEDDEDRISKISGTFWPRIDRIAALFAAEENRALFPRADYITAVFECPIGPYTRTMLTRWIFAVARDTHVPIPVETAALAVNYLDRCLSQRSICLAALQKLAATCLWIAAKLAHGDNVPLDLVTEIAPDSTMELVVLHALRWRLLVPTPMTFLPLLCRKFRLETTSASQASHFVQELIARTYRRLTQ